MKKEKLNEKLENTLNEIKKYLYGKDYLKSKLFADLNTEITTLFKDFVAFENQNVKIGNKIHIVKPMKNTENKKSKRKLFEALKS